LYRFWDTVIGPILHQYRPKVIVEIGCASGLNTRQLLEYCRENSAVLHSVDPTPGFDVQAWERESDGRLHVHRAPSLDVLSSLDSFDLVLIDGDHNWYTVYNELLLLEARSKELRCRFPLVILHDTSWPYGRRDLYYDPEKIPSSYRQAYARKGLKPGDPGLQDQGGFNPDFCHAIIEGGPRNGVRTAIESFLDHTSLPLRLIDIPSLHGLGILVPSAPVGHQSCPLHQFELPHWAMQYVERVEQLRVDALFERTTWEQRAIELKARLEAASAEMADAVVLRDSEIERLKGAVKALQER